jgi:hypothetical protein
LTAAHARQAIREGAATLLKTSPTNWGQVYETRIVKKRPTKDFLIVFSDGDASEKDSIHEVGDYERRCTLVVVGHLRMPGNTDTETIEDRMDAVAAEIETKLTFSTLQAVAGLSKLGSLDLTSTEMTVVVDEQDAPDHAEVTLLFVAGYTTAEGSPATLI